MRTRMLTISLLTAALLVAPGALAAESSSSPYVGSVGQGETDSYVYDTHGGQPCLAIWMPRVYTVTLAHAPLDDTLTLTAAGESDVSSDGTASVSFVANYCTRFSIQVEGTSVEDVARYGVTVQSIPLEGQIASEPAVASASMCPSVQGCIEIYSAKVFDLIGVCDPPDGFDVPLVPDC